VSAESDAQREVIVNALRLTALPAEKQVVALPDFVHVPDEVALVYGDAFLFVPRLREGDLITQTQADALYELDRHFADMTTAPDREAVWTVSAMQTDERWAEARRLAADALNLLGASLGPPDIDGTTWIRG
jgi:hypothetical protein